LVLNQTLFTDHIIGSGQYELGVAYYTGEGVVENGEEAVKWFLAAAEKDHPAAW
jgi:TPR repeat protein